MPGSSGLPLAGVEAIVEGLSAFQGDIRSMNSALDSLRPRQTLLQGAFEGAWEAVKNFGREILNVAEYALGHLLADAIQFAIQKIGELIQATIDAGSEFQTLEIRLRGMNLDALVKSGADMETAEKESIRLTKIQLDWLQKLAATTPYDNTDISNVYTLARSYGFADEAAKELTKNTVDFAAGMGLSKEVLERVIMNLGQMVQRGKITSTEMRDLARGAFLPLNDVLERIATKSGKSVVEVMKEISKPGGGLPAQLFIDAFNEMVREEPRFTGAAERMAKTFKAASDNAMDIVKSIGGLNVVKPILDVIGERISAFTGSFTDDPAKWDRLVAAASRLGTALANVFAQVLNLLPASNTLADMAVAGVEKLAGWIEAHKDDIVAFFVGIGDTIRDKIIPWIQNHLVPMFERISSWVQENGPLIKEFFSTVGEMVSEFFDDITGGGKGKEKGGGDVLDSITRFMRFVIDNKDEIVKWVEILWSVFIVWQVISTIWNIAIGIMITLGGAILGLVSIVGGLIAILSVPLVGAVALVIVTFMAAIAAGWALGQAIVGALLWIKNNITWIDWKALGASIVQGLINGINGLLPGLGNVLITGMITIYNKVKSFLGIHSPSTLFAGLGTSMMEGLAQGISNGVSTVTGGLDHILSVINEKLNHMMSVAEEKLSHLSSILGGGGIDFSSIGMGISAAWAYGIDLGSKVAEKAGRNMAEKTTNSARKALRARSPSKIFEDLGMFTVQGFAQGIEKAAGEAVGAMQGAMSAAMVPAISSMAAARSSGNTINNNRSANLTIHTSAPVEPILQDYRMLESLMGA